MTATIVLYDGECQFCNKWICFVKSKLQKNEISFLPFNSSTAINILKDYKIVNQDAVVYIKDDIVCLKSRAVLKICRQLKFPYNLLHFLTILPTFLLNFCYDFAAKRRLSFNSNKQCCNG
jgi:predicted DCC family thiol-disulfide oxidoreductase YuxK